MGNAPAVRGDKGILEREKGCLGGQLGPAR